MRLHFNFWMHDSKSWRSWPDHVSLRKNTTFELAERSVAKSCELEGARSIQKPALPDALSSACVAKHHSFKRHHIVGVVGNAVAYVDVVPLRDWHPSLGVVIG